MVRVFMIHIVTALIALTPMNAKAFFDYDVDMPNSGDPKTQMIRIVIDGCTSKFFIPKDEFEKFTSDKKNLTQLIKKAIERTSNGCN